MQDSDPDAAVEAGLIDCNLRLRLEDLAGGLAPNDFVDARSR